jgi:hypothetical protein
MTIMCAVRLVVAALAVSLSACAETNVGPTAAASSVFVANAGGIWVGTLVPTSSAARFNQPGAGTCSESDFAVLIGHNAPATLTVTQAATSVTGRLTAENVGLSCAYTGTADLTTMSLDATDCDGSGLHVLCANGPSQLDLVGSSVRVTVRGNRVYGTAASTYNILPLEPGAPLGSVAISSAFEAERR